MNFFPFAFGTFRSPRTKSPVKRNNDLHRIRKTVTLSSSQAHSKHYLSPSPSGFRSSHMGESWPMKCGGIGPSLRAPLFPQSHVCELGLLTIFFFFFKLDNMFYLFPCVAVLEENNLVPKNQPCYLTFSLPSFGASLIPQ